LVLIAVVVGAWYVRHRMGALRERAEAAYPGPLEPPGGPRVSEVCART